MRQIITLLILVFVFFGCVQKQTVPLKLPQTKEKVNEIKIKKEKPSTEVITPVIEGLKPIDIKVSDGSLDNSVQAIEEDNIQDNVIISEIQVDLAKVKIKVAFIYPSSLVEKYAKTSLSTISGYLSYQKADYDLTIIDSTNESYENINSAFEKAKQNGVTKVIGLFTPSAISSLDKIVTDDVKVYLPLIEKKDSLTSNENLIFGSISYEQQVKKLISYSSTNNAMFYQDTYIGNKLKRAYDASVYDTRVRKEISKTETNFKYIVNDYKLNNSTLFLNTDLVKTSLILSQLRAYDISPSAILSTQVTYDPMLMLLTQNQDREKLVVANSIDSVNSELRDEINTFGGNIVYEWVDYSTLVGINYLYYGNNSNLVQTKIIDNEAVYNPKLYRSTDVGFLEIK
ncbi:hypothetical protein AACT_1020 [Arcobacter acticola]|uniref:Penicillin-binding protein activator n=1 Tax=Arcobacter acticola TaxID=1849015 RepID=A0A6M8EE09_9BACT|nr:hypothetical protein [Arcobacter acticola]QKE28212.1 hypothetical protein AACT_1020 [Arcobacter acticola]